MKLSKMEVNQRLMGVYVVVGIIYSEHYCNLVLALLRAQLENIDSVAISRTQVQIKLCGLFTLFIANCNNSL